MVIDNDSSMTHRYPIFNFSIVNGELAESDQNVPSSSPGVFVG